MAVLLLHPDAIADLSRMVPSERAVIAVCLRKQSQIRNWLRIFWTTGMTNKGWASTE